MKLQRFVGKNTKSVLEEIRTILGEEALIVSNTKMGSKTEIIAASEAKSLDSNSSAITKPDSPDTSKDGDNFADVMASQKGAQEHRGEEDPWTYIKSINDEIRSIKSSLKGLPKSNTSVTPNPAQQTASEHQEIRSEDPLQTLRTISQGCHIVWGERKSGKTLLVKGLMEKRADNHEQTMLLRLPHKNSNSDSHLAAIGAKYSVNLFLINQVESIESTINLFSDKYLIFIEADLSMLPSLAANQPISWLAKSSNYIIDEDKKQTELVCDLFQKFQTEKPIKVSSRIIEAIS